VGDVPRSKKSSWQRIAHRSDPRAFWQHIGPRMRLSPPARASAIHLATAGSEVAVVQAAYSSTIARVGVGVTSSTQPRPYQHAARRAGLPVFSASSSQAVPVFPRSFLPAGKNAFSLRKARQASKICCTSVLGVARPGLSAGELQRNCRGTRHVTSGLFIFIKTHSYIDIISPMRYMGAA